MVTYVDLAIESVSMAICRRAMNYFSKLFIICKIFKYPSGVSSSWWHILVSSPARQHLWQACLLCPSSLYFNVQLSSLNKCGSANVDDNDLVTSC
jgi:hypothetical protein